MLNPFRNWIAGDAWGAPEADVGDLGEQAFDACRRAIAATTAEHRSAAVLVRGEPGSGKTHLLRRLREHLAQSRDERLRETLFVYVRLLTTPNLIWRHLRRRIADDLMRVRPDGVMQLEQLMYRMLAEDGSRGRLLDEWKIQLRGDLQWDARGFAKALAVTLRAIREDKLASLDLFDTLHGEHYLLPSLVHVLRRLVRRQRLGLVRGWLRGDSLTAEDLTRLGVEEDPTAEEDPEDAAREMVFQLARLAGQRMPMVLCFDQVEALEAVPGDKAGFAAFGAMASALHDGADNLTLISCMQTSVHENFRRADFDRIAESEALLPLLNRYDARRLIHARLEAAGPAARWNPPAEFDAVFNEVGLASARRVLCKAAELFDRARQKEAAPAMSEAAMLEREWESRMEAAAESAAQDSADEILDQGLQALAAAAHPNWKVTRGAGDIDFRLETSAGPIDVSVVNQRNMNSLSARLRRLGATPRTSARLVLLRDARMGIPRGAKVTRERLDDLVGRGARVVRPSIEAIEALQALRTLLADQRSGDLTRDGAPIAPQGVADWLRQSMPRALAELMEEIAGRETPPPQNEELRENLLDLLERRCVIALDEAARELGDSQTAVRRMALASPSIVGLLEGPPETLYRVAAGV